MLISELTNLFAFNELSEAVSNSVFHCRIMRGRFIVSPSAPVVNPLDRVYGCSACQCRFVAFSLGISQRWARIICVVFVKKKKKSLILTHLRVWLCCRSGAMRGASVWCTNYQMDLFHKCACGDWLIDCFVVIAKHSGHLSWLWYQSTNN